MGQDEDDSMDYKILAEKFKDEGNAAFQSGTTEGLLLSIEMYSKAIETDPDNHIYYSNRSASHLKNDSKSKALWDAEKCVELAPNWAKGYSRLGAGEFLYIMKVFANLILSILLPLLLLFL